MLKAALIIPWFGKDLKGGAEQHAWQIASRLGNRGISVTILTTCSKQFLSDWSHNHYKPGEYRDGNLRILRFPVDTRDTRLFDKVNARLLGIQKSHLPYAVIPKVEQAIYLSQNINSSRLLEYLRNHDRDYRAFIFLPYLFPLVIKGIGFVENKSVLVPCLHDECYAYLPSVREAFDKAARIVFNSEGEKDLAIGLFGGGIAAKSVTAGGGVEVDGEAFKDNCQKRIVTGKYLLCLGRRDVGKNTHMLVETFEEFLRITGCDIKLVLAGPGTIPVKSESTKVIDLGLVSEEEKANLLHHCSALVNPSESESFSRVLYEAWFAKKPVIVNKNCLATFRALRESGAGWCADSRHEFISVFQQVATMSESELKVLGNRGFSYASNSADWDKVIDRYSAVITDMANNPSKQVRDKLPSRIRDCTVIIMYHTIQMGDAVGNDILKEKEVLESAGYRVHLFAEHYDARLSYVRLTERQLARYIEDESTIIIYHHANHWVKGEEIVNRSACKVVVKYHNVTPPEFFTQYNIGISESCKAGREQTARLVGSGRFCRFLADSPYNAQELIECGADRERVEVLAPFHKANDFMTAGIHSGLLEQMYHGKINVLSVGRVAPHKGCHHLIEIVREYVRSYDRNIFLNIAGGVDSQLSRYFDNLNSKIYEYGIEDIVAFRHHVSFDELNTYYQASDVFILMSEHEGFCLPILEAQYHNLPVIALDRAAVKSTLGPNQLLFSDVNYLEIAAAIRVICYDKGVNAYLRAQGRDNYLKFQESVLFDRFLNCLAMVHSKA